MQKPNLKVPVVATFGIALAVAVAACGGGSNTTGGGGSGPGPGNGVGGASAQGTGQSTAQSTTQGPSAGSKGTGGGMPCPDASGFYGDVTAEGAGCTLNGATVDTSSPVCVMMAQQICAFQLVSMAKPSTSVGAADGVIVLQSDGSFTGAAIEQGTQQRSGCEGTVDGSAIGSTITIECGGTDPTSSQYCKITLTKGAAGCP